MIVFYVVILLAVGVAHGAKSKAAKTDPNDNKGNTPFFLQDPNDETCLGPDGFTVCDERALWVLTRRPGKKTYSIVSLLKPNKQGACLERKTSWFGSTDKLALGPCRKEGSKSWNFEFIDQSHVKLSSKGQCLVRGKKKYRSSMSMQNCKKGEFVALKYHPTAVHENGFYLKAADGACFDGSVFRSCDAMISKKILWGVGIKYLWGKANRYFFNFAPSERTNCIVAKGSSVERGECSSKGALKWALEDGKLTFNDGKSCLARLVNNKAALVSCAEASEYMVMDVPSKE